MSDSRPVVHAFAGSLPHFAEWLIPIWNALPVDIKGGFHAAGRAEIRAREAGIEVLPRVPKTDLIMVASHSEYRRCAPAEVIFVNHGAGQRYVGDSKAATNPSYSGGRDRSRVVLHLCPREDDAMVCRSGGAQAAVIGTPPYLDRFVGRSPRRHGERPIVAISFHADITICPESRWAFPHYQNAIADIVRGSSLSFEFIGHSHPRSIAFMRKFWGRLHVPFVEQWADVLDRADLYVCDISSTLYEFAATDRPVVVLDAPWYRKHVHHGLRFWEYADVGIRIQEPVQLLPAIGAALSDRPPIRAHRQEIIRHVYSGLDDGYSTERAVDAIVSLLRDRVP